MADYTEMSEYYDVIMTSGYYDYDAIVDCLARREGDRSVLEIGAGTGLVLERLAARRPDLEITGIDVTPAMLAIARERLSACPRVATHLQDVVTLSLNSTYDLAFSYGGVWYFVPDGGGGLSMVSHLRDDTANRQALERVAAHLPVGGALMLGVQAPHLDYARPVADGLEYRQRITALPKGFRKDYWLADAGRTVMEQTIDYRLYPFGEALELLAACGFEHQDPRPNGSGDRSPLFVEFGRR